jgi:hypothetical protein
MKRLMTMFAAAAMLAACGSAAANDREVASLSTAFGDATGPGDTTGDSSGEATDTTGVVDPSDAPLKYAKCMREHGVDMPDPQISEDGGVMIAIGGPGSGQGDDSGNEPDPKEMEAANKACQHFMEDAATGFDPPSEEDQKKMQEQALAFAKCMRDHGIDMPDPQFSADGGGFSISLGSSPAGGTLGNAPPVDVNDDEFKAANEACGGPGGGGFAIATGPVGG